MKLILSISAQMPKTKMGFGQVSTAWKLLLVVQGLGFGVQGSWNKHPTNLGGLLRSTILKGMCWSER